MSNYHMGSRGKLQQGAKPRVTLEINWAARFRNSFQISMASRPRDLLQMRAGRVQKAPLGRKSSKLPSPERPRYGNL